LRHFGSKVDRFLSICIVISIQNQSKAKEKRKPVTNILSNLYFVMKWITTRAEETGRMEEEITVSAVDRMFEAGHFSEGECDGQKKGQQLSDPFGRSDDNF